MSEQETTLTTDRPNWQTRAARVWRWVMPRLPRLMLNLFLVAIIVGLLLACYAPVYFGGQPEDRPPRRGR